MPAGATSTSLVPRVIQLNGDFSSSVAADGIRYTLLLEVPLVEWRVNADPFTLHSDLYLLRRGVLGSRRMRSPWKCMRRRCALLREHLYMW